MLLTSRHSRASIYDYDFKAWLTAANRLWPSGWQVFINPEGIAQTVTEFSYQI